MSSMKNSEEKTEGFVDPSDIASDLVRDVEALRDQLAGQVSEILHYNERVQNGEKPSSYFVDNHATDLLRGVSNLLHRVRLARVDFDKSWRDIVETLQANRFSNKSLQDQLSKALEKKAPTHRIYDPAVRNEVWRMTDGKCVYCDTAVKQEDMHVDHFVPKSSDGPDHINNYVPACQPCNMAKRDKHPVQFIREKLGHNVVRINPNIDAA